MNKCKWCDQKYNELEADEERIRKNLQYRWDTFNFCSLECCQRSWEADMKKKFEKVMYAVLWSDGSIQHVLHTRGEANVRRQAIAKENDILKKAIKIVRVLVKEL